ncbi:MAG: hypothetical protein ACYTFK_13725 [Planctomycetota bacterium]|jgi:hypothetical protein
MKEHHASFWMRGDYEWLPEHGIQNWFYNIMVGMWNADYMEREDWDEAFNELEDMHKKWK